MTLISADAVDPAPEPKGGSMAQVLMVALATVMFSLPSCTGSALLHYVFYLCFLVVFIVLVFVHTRHSGISLALQLKQKNPLILYLLLAFAVSSLVSCLNVFIDHEDSFRRFMMFSRYLFYVVVTLYVFALARLIRVSGESSSRLFIAYIYGTVFLVALFLFAYHNGGAYGASGWGVNPPFGRHVRLMGMGAAVAVTAAIALFYFGRQALPVRVMLWLSLVVCNAFLIWTGSRTSLLLVLLMTLLLTIIFLAGRKAFLSPALLLLAMALSFPVAAKVSIFEWTGLQRSLKVSVVEVPSGVADSQTLFNMADKLSSGRLAIWQAAIDAWRVAPWFGHGPNSTVFVLDYPDTIDQPHNMFLQFLLEWGVVGATLLSSFLLLMAWQGLRKLPAVFRQGDSDYIVSASVILVLVMNGLTDGPFYHVQTVLCLATAFAVFPFRPLGAS